MPTGKRAERPPRSGTVRAATLPAEIGDNRAPFPDPESLSCPAGDAPSTRSNGPHRALRATATRHPRADRIPARSRAHIIRRCWQDRTPHDPTRRGAARRLRQETARHRAAHAGSSSWYDGPARAPATESNPASHSSVRCVGSISSSPASRASAGRHHPSSTASCPSATGT